jgi:hypothetical protein
MSKQQSYVRNHDGIDILFNRSEDGTLTCEPVDIEKFEAYAAGLGPDGVRAKVADLRADDEGSRAWREAAEKRLNEIADELRQQKLEALRVEIHGR